MDGKIHDHVGIKSFSSKYIKSFNISSNKMYIKARPKRFSGSCYYFLYYFYLFFPCYKGSFGWLKFKAKKSTNYPMATDFYKDLPPTTLHVRIISSPSSMGPTVVLFIIRPQRSRIIGGSGRTEKRKAMIMK